MPVISLVVFLVISLFFMVLIQIHLFEIAFTKLGLTPETTLMLVFGTLVGSGINLPLFELQTKQAGHLVELPNRKLIWELFQPAREGKVMVAVNVGGCIIPVGLCIYFISLQLIDPVNLLISLSAITFLSYRSSRVIPNMGIGMPLLVAPLFAALLALILEPEHTAQLAYIAGVLGVLIGADMLRIKQISDLGAPIASIGGAGTFDGIFLTGIIAVLLA
ncbi:MAG: DUF1614 domain-containing protein [Methylococcales bacterium]|nr:DUF1614 domain-containing protein [Methylococcales bacterium]MDP3839154.1 DUF1614 domain-containing protein [Methylococcales bacterium]